MAAHPGMRFSVDPWDPSYGVSLDAADGQSQQKVDVDVELLPDRWRPIDPEPGVAPPAAVLFVDGVRRVDAQVWVDGDAGGDVDAAEAVPALCASYAAGVVCCCPRDGAHLAAAEVRRGLVTTAAHAVDVVTGAGRYTADVIELKANQVPGQVLSQRVQGLLNEVEIAVAARAREQLGVDDDLIVVDGPLRGRDRLARALGYIKTHHTAYLDPEQNEVVGRLGAGQRTPLFRLTSIGGWRRYTLVPAPALRAGGAVGRGRPAGVQRRAARAGRRDAGRPQPGDAAAVRVGGLQGLPRAAEPLPDRGSGAGAAPAARGRGGGVPGAADGGGPPGGRGGGRPVDAAAGARWTRRARRPRPGRWPRSGGSTTSPAAPRSTRRCPGSPGSPSRTRSPPIGPTTRPEDGAPRPRPPSAQPASRCRSPLARLTGRATAARTAASDPTTRTNSRARVTAVYSSSRVSSGDSAGGSTTVTRANWLPCPRCTVIACTVATSASREGASGSRDGKATRGPSGVATTTPVSPL